MADDQLTVEHIEDTCINILRHLTHEDFFINDFALYYYILNEARKRGYNTHSKSKVRQLAKEIVAQRILKQVYSETKERLKKLFDEEG